MSIAVVYGEHLIERPHTINVASQLKQIDNRISYHEVPTTYGGGRISSWQIEFWKRFGHYIFEDIPPIADKEQFSKWWRIKRGEQEKAFDKEYRKILEKYDVIINLHATHQDLVPDRSHQWYDFIYNKDDQLMTSIFHDLRSDILTIESNSSLPHKTEKYRTYHHHHRTGMIVEFYTGYPITWRYEMQKLFGFNEPSAKIASRILPDEALKEILKNKDEFFLKEMLRVRELRVKEGAIVTYAVALNPIEIKLGIR
jgi:hypothetical protein